MERVLADIDANHGDCSVECLRHGVLLVFGTPCQLRSLAGQEHGRTIPLADIPWCSASRSAHHLYSFFEKKRTELRCLGTGAAKGTGQKILPDAHVDLTIRGPLPFIVFGRDKHRHAAGKHFIAAVIPSQHRLGRCAIVPPATVLRIPIVRTGRQGRSGHNGGRHSAKDRRLCDPPGPVRGELQLPIAPDCEHATLPSQFLNQNGP